MFDWELHQTQEQKFFIENRIGKKLELTEKEK